MAVKNTEVCKLYIAFFERAPDQKGLQYWAEESGLSIEGIARSFFDQPETQEKYPESLSDEDFVTTIYRNLFNREPDSGGLQYWVDELEKYEQSGGAEGVPREQMILAFVNGAQDEPEQGIYDATILSHKTEAGLHYAASGLEYIDYYLDDVNEEISTLVGTVERMDRLASQPASEVAILPSGSLAGDGVVADDELDQKIELEGWVYRTVPGDLTLSGAVHDITFEIPVEKGRYRAEVSGQDLAQDGDWKVTLSAKLSDESGGTFRDTLEIPYAVTADFPVLALRGGEDARISYDKGIGPLGIPYAGVASGELHLIDLSGFKGTVDFGVVAKLNGEEFRFVMGEKTAKATLKLGEANVGGSLVAPHLATKGSWEFFLGAGGTLEIDGATTFDEGELAIQADKAQIVISGIVDWRKLADLELLDMKEGGGSFLLKNGSVLLMTDAQWHAAELPQEAFTGEDGGHKATLHVTQELVDKLDGDLTEVRGYAAYDLEKGVRLILREDQAKQAYVGGDENRIGRLEDAFVTVQVGGEEGDHDLRGLYGIKQLILESEGSFEVTLRPDQADALSGKILKNGHKVQVLVERDRDQVPTDLSDPDGNPDTKDAYDLREADLLWCMDGDGMILDPWQLRQPGQIKAGGPVFVSARGDLRDADLSRADVLLAEGEVWITAIQQQKFHALRDGVPGRGILHIDGLEALAPHASDGQTPQIGSKVDLDFSNVHVSHATANLATEVRDVDDHDGDGDRNEMMDAHFLLDGDLGDVALWLEGSGTVEAPLAFVDGATIDGGSARIDVEDDSPNSDPRIFSLGGVGESIAGTYNLDSKAHTHLERYDLGAFSIHSKLAPNHNRIIYLHASAEQMNGRKFSADSHLTDFDISLTDPTKNVDLSGIEDDIHVNVRFSGGSGDVRLSPDSNFETVDAFSIDSQASGITSLSLLAEQIDGRSMAVDSSSKLHKITITDAQEVPDLNLNGLPTTQVPVEVQVETSPDEVVLFHDAWLGDSTLHVTGTGGVAYDKETFGEGAVHYGNGHSIFLDEGSTFYVTDDTALVDASHASFSGRGTYYVDHLHGGTVFLSDEIKHTVVDLSRSGHIAMRGFVPGTFAYSQNETGWMQLRMHALCCHHDKVVYAASGTISDDTAVLIYTRMNADTSTDADDLQDLFDGDVTNFHFSKGGDLYVLFSGSWSGGTNLWYLRDENDDGEYRVADDDAELIASFPDVKHADDFEAINFDLYY